MKTIRYPTLRKTADFMRSLGYSERSIREVVRESRREIIRHRTLFGTFLLKDEQGKPKGGGGSPCML